ncbi:hypothetical protein [Corynebacterium lowii]|uniref:Uncharacterized protein n=1 Tax=Corynebacterium lowii TaxID=1544413 RepID=A0A0Q1E321_9CORY|nr:hypothetical protein [Corynebacterium lowii]KQB87037.1 hypothetical protein Clow_00082 [Corynebacterium lowii]MDP9852381.1 hypothetical protein [Corynebacterium lowii]
MKALFRTLLFGGLLGEIALVSLTLAGYNPATWIYLLILGFVILALGILFGSLLLSTRKKGSWLPAIESTATRFGVPAKVLSYWVSEVLMLRSLFSRAPSGETYSYSRPLRIIVWAISLLAIVEITVVHLLFSSTTWGVILAVLSVYGLLVLLGFYSSLRTQPHSVSAEGIMLRSGRRFQLFLPWEHIARAGAQRPGDGPNIEVSEEGFCRLPVLNQVNTVIHLSEPATARDLFLGEVTVNAVEFCCDDREAFLERIAAEAA